MKSKLKQLLLVLLTAATAVVLSVTFMTACYNPDKETYGFVVPDGVTVAIFADMWGVNFEFDDLQYSAKIDYAVTTEAAVASQFTEGKEFIMAPLNVGANMHNAAVAGKATYDYKLMNVTSWGVLYFVTTESGYLPYTDSQSAIEFLSQFDGKTVQTIGGAAIPGKTAEYLFNEANASVTLEGSDASTIQASIARGDSVTAVFAEPAITALKSMGKELTVLGSVADVYSEVVGSEFPMAGLFVRSDVCEKRKELISAINARVSVSVDAFHNNIDYVGEKTESIENCTVKAAAIKNASPNINVKFRDSEQSKTAVKTLLGKIGVNADDTLFV